MFENYSNVNARYERAHRLYDRLHMLVNDPFGVFRVAQMDHRFMPLFEYEMTVAHKAQYPRRRIIKFENVDEEVHKAITGKVHDIGYVFFEDRCYTYWRLDHMLRDLAPHVDMTPTEDMRIVKTQDTGVYRSQGFGQYKYARAALMTDKKLLDGAGFTTEIREYLWGDALEDAHKPNDVYHYQLWANGHRYQLHALTRGYTKLAWATDCWKRGVNPQVYDPFMSHEMVSKSLIAAGFSG